MTPHSSWSETHALITAALKMAPGERDPFLRRHCPDPALCESLLLLLRSRERQGEAMTTPAADVQQVLADGSRVGRYVILHSLGRGGMGEVFLGRDPQLYRQVAIKCVFSSSDGDEDVRARVLREARAAAGITHPNVAVVHDVVEADGRAFIVMEYVQGESLAGILKRETLPPQRVLEVGLQLSSALAAAHAAGVVHRDLKPSNIHVTPDGSIKILDFGIALALAARANATTRTGGSGSPPARGPQPGTPAYMSPEQLLGLSADERSDLFSLALVLFEMATGRRPYSSVDPVDMVLEAGAGLPRADHVDPRVPRALADVVATGLAADPRNRYQTAVEMAAALTEARRRLVADRGAVRSGPRAWPRPYAWVWRTAVAAVALPIALGILGFVSAVGYNNTLGRTGGFANEPLWAYVVWGGRSLVGPAGYAVTAVIVFWALRFAADVAALTPPLGRAVDRFRVWLAHATATLGLDDPLVLARALATVGFVALAGVVWRFDTLMEAWAIQVSTAVPERLWPLGPENEDEKVLYRAVLTCLLLAFAAGLGRVVHLRLRTRFTRARGATAIVGAVLAIIVALVELPYRTMWHADEDRIEYGDGRCYAIGKTSTQYLLYCPETPPPRNRVVDATDPALHPMGVVEDIFTDQRAR